MLLLTLITAIATAATVEGPAFPDDLARSHVLRNYQETRVGMHPRDRVPDGLDRTMLQDEVRITSLEGDSACFEVITRTSSTDESTMGQWAFVVGKKNEVWGKELQVEVFDYAYTGERTKLDLSIFGERSGGALRVTEPEDRIFRVIERTQEVCGDKVLEKKGRISLRVELRGPHKYDEAYVETFRWIPQ